MNMSATTKINFRTFQPPPNYTENSDGSEGQLFVEDLKNEDNELWLFQTSRGFDSSSLKNKVISLQGETVFQDENCLSKEKSHKISVFTNSVNELLGYQLVLPSKSKGGLFPVSLPFVGHLNLTENINKPRLSISTSQSVEKEKEDFSNLRQRYVPFGSDDPLITTDTPKKHKHKKKSDSYHSNEHIYSDTPVSSKKRVSFKSPLTEIQGINVHIEVENSNSIQQEHFSDVNKSCQSNKQTKLCENNASQEAIPKKLKLKKKKHDESILSSSNLFSEEEKLLPFEACLIPSHETDPSEKTESAEKSEQGLCFINVSRSHKHKKVKKKELCENGGIQDDATKHTKSKEEKKSNKSQKTEHLETSALLLQQQEKNKLETTARKSFQYSPSQDTKGFYKMPVQNVLSENDSFQSDTRNGLDNSTCIKDETTKHTKSKKKKKKSNEHTNRNTSESEEIKFSYMTPLIKPDEKNVSVEAHTNIIPQDTKYSPKVKKKQLSENDESQDETTNHTKSKKRKMSDKSSKNEHMGSHTVFEEKLSQSHESKPENLRFQQSLNSLGTQNATKLFTQKDLPGNDSFQNGTKHMKSKKKKKKLNEYTSSNTPVSEEEKLLCTAPLIQFDEKNVFESICNNRNSEDIKFSPKIDIETVSFGSASNSSKDTEISDDKRQTKKEKKAKKHNRKNLSFLPGSLNEFEEKKQDFETKHYSGNTSLIGSNRESCATTHNTKNKEDNKTFLSFPNLNEKDIKDDFSKYLYEDSKNTKDNISNFNLNIIKRESKFVQNQGNVSAKKERKKKHHNDTESNEVVAGEDKKSDLSIYHPEDCKIKKEKPTTIKKHTEKKKKSHSQTSVGDSSNNEVLKYFEENIITKEEKPNLKVNSIKQECLSDSANEILAKSHKKRKRSDEQLEYFHLLSTDVKDWSAKEFYRNTIKEEENSANHKCLLPNNIERDDSKHFTTTLQRDEMPYLNLNGIKQEFSSDNKRKSYKKHKEKKMHTQPENFQLAIKDEVLSDDQTNKLFEKSETVYKQKTEIAVKQEVFSDCDNKFSIKQEPSDNICSALTKPIKTEIKPDPENDALTVKNKKRKRNENPEETYSEDKDVTNNYNKAKKLKIHKKNEY